MASESTWAGEAKYEREKRLDSERCSRNESATAASRFNMMWTMAVSRETVTGHREGDVPLQTKNPLSAVRAGRGFTMSPGHRYIASRGGTPGEPPASCPRCAFLATRSRLTRSAPFGGREYIRQHILSSSASTSSSRRACSPDVDGPSPQPPATQTPQWTQRRHVYSAI